MAIRAENERLAAQLAEASQTLAQLATTLLSGAVGTGGEARAGGEKEVEEWGMGADSQSLQLSVCTQSTPNCRP